MLKKIPKKVVLKPSILESNFEGFIEELISKLSDQDSSSTMSLAPPFSAEYSVRSEKLTMWVVEAFMDLYIYSKAMIPKRTEREEDSVHILFTNLIFSFAILHLIQLRIGQGQR